MAWPCSCISPREDLAATLYAGLSRARIFLELAIENSGTTSCNVPPNARHTFSKSSSYSVRRFRPKSLVTRWQDEMKSANPLRQQLIFPVPVKNIIDDDHCSPVNQILIGHLHVSPLSEHVVHVSSRDMNTSLGNNSIQSKMSHLWVLPNGTSDDLR